MLSGGENLVAERRDEAVGLYVLVVAEGRAAGHAALARPAAEVAACLAWTGLTEDNMKAALALPGDDRDWSPTGPAPPLRNREAGASPTPASPRPVSPRGTC